MSNPVCSSGHTPARSASSLGHAGRRAATPRRSCTSVGHPADEHRPETRLPARAMPGLELGRRRRRCRSAGGGGAAATARPARPSGGRRGTARAARRAATCPCSASISSHSAAKSKISRAATQARVTSTTEAPVSSVIRWSNEIPDRLTIWLTTLGGDDLAPQRVARGSASAYRLLQRGREVGDEIGLEHGRRAGPSAPSRRRWRSSCRRSARRTRATAARARPPGARRSACRVGRNSRARSSQPSCLQHVEVAGVDVDHRQGLAAGDQPAPASGPGCCRAPARRPRRSSSQQLVALLRRSARRRRRRRRGGS